MNNTKNYEAGQPVLFFTTPNETFDAMAFIETHEQLVNELEDRLALGFRNVALPERAVTFTYEDRTFRVTSAWTRQFPTNQENKRASELLRCNLRCDICLICEEVA